MPPGNQEVHTFQKQFPTSLVLLALEFQVRKGRLIHLCSHPRPDSGLPALLCHITQNLFRVSLERNIIG